MLAEIANLTDDLAYLVVFLYSLTDSGIGNIYTVNVV